MDSKELQEALGLRERAMTRVKNELNRIMLEQPTILGLDGNPLESSQDKMADAVLELMGKYLKAPTMTEQELVPALKQNSIEGASLSLMSLVTLTVFEPAKEMAPNLAQLIPQVFMYLLGHVVEKSPIPQNGLTELVKEISKFINMSAQDGEGHGLILGEDLEKLKLRACNELLIVLTSQAVAMGLMTMTEESIEISPDGDRLFRHMIAVNKWITPVQEAIAGTSPLILPG